MRGAAEHEPGVGMRVVHAAGTCDAMVGDQRVVLHMPSRALHALRADASAIWPFLDGSANVDELERELADLGPGPLEDARSTVSGWVAPLLEAGLLEVVPEPPA